MKKHFSLFLAVLFLFTAGIPMTGVYAYEWEGAGTAESPYLIKTAEDFLGLVENDGSNYLKVFRLENNLTLPDNQFVATFNGQLDGNGKTVTVNITSGSKVGLIGELKWGSSVKNLTVAGTINASGATAGGIVGEIGNYTTLSNCVNKANITANIVGGIMGLASGKNNFTISGCRNEGSITASSHAGGIAGSLQNSTTTVSLCSNYGAVSSSGWGGTGGIAGYATNGVTIQTSYNAGEVSQSSNNPVGGITAGNMSTSGAIVTNCFNAGSINGSQVAAIAYATDNMTNSYNAYPGLPMYSSAAAASGNYSRNDGATTAQSGVTLLTHKQMLDTASFSGFDFDSIWTAGNETYLYPQLQGNVVTETITLPDPPAEPDFESGSGTKADPYIIKTADQFKNMAKSVYNDANDSTIKFFKLDANIDLTSGYTPFIFNGNLDGNNKTVTVNINLPEEDNVGLFRGMKTVWNCQIFNLVIEGSVTGKNNVGGLLGTTGPVNGVGALGYNGLIENVTNRASVTATGAQAGGIVGRDYQSKDGSALRNLRNEGTIVSGGDYAGGIAGVSNHNLTGCSNSGSVTAAQNACGGIVGWLAIGVNAALTVENSYNTGDITGYGSVGGIIGSALYKSKELTVQNCYNAGTIQSTNNADLAGIVGQGSALSTTVQNCYNIGTVRKGALFNPIVSEASTSEATVTNCYYLTPSAETAKYGTPKTIEEMKAAVTLLGSAFTDGTGAYLYPQLSTNTNSQAEPVFHILTITAGENGTASPIGIIYVVEGKTQLVTITPETGFAIETVKYNDVDVYGYTEEVLEYTTPEITADAAVAITFKKEETTPAIAQTYQEVFTSTGTDTIDGKVISGPKSIVFAKVQDTTGYTLTEFGIEFAATSDILTAGNGIRCKATKGASLSGNYGICFYGDFTSGTTYYVRPYAIYTKDGEAPLVVYGDTVEITPNPSV